MFATAVCLISACSAPAGRTGPCTAPAGRTGPCTATRAQVGQALAQQQATKVASQQAGIQKRIEAEATKRAEKLVKLEKEKQKQTSAKDANATKQTEDDTTSRGSAGGPSRGAKKRKDIADANAEKAKVEKERGELRGALKILEE